jgi:hypothetical protein
MIEYTSGTTRMRLTFPKTPCRSPNAATLRLLLTRISHQTPSQQTSRTRLMTSAWSELRVLKSDRSMDRDVDVDRNAILVCELARLSAPLERNETRNKMKAVLISALVRSRSTYQNWVDAPGLTNGLESDFRRSVNSLGSALDSQVKLSNTRFGSHFSEMTVNSRKVTRINSLFPPWVFLPFPWPPAT